ncbi:MULTISPECIES: S66 peptidase family protein [unclassified Carboxylicivirga]|uniref:S66 peptidase family protein n=1 Tax=Carboxylicivirga TaxID=1628153 RepID=UPI003D33F5E0
MILPKPLKKGDTIGIVAPAGKIAAEAIHYAEKLLHSMGYQVVLGKNVFNTFHRFAGNDAHRAADLQEMLNRTDIDTILCARGGYGTLRIIDKIDFTHYRKQPKWLVGFSDITVLHAALQNCLGIASLHGPMPKNFCDKSKEDEDLVNLFKVLHGHRPAYTIRPHDHNRIGEAEGVLSGGNLALLYGLRATPYDTDPQGKILFIEDVGEHLYHLDRMMHNLKISGFLADLSGMVVGDFTEMKDNDEPFGQSAYDIIKAAVDDYDYPVLFGFPAGHSHLNQPLIMGHNVNLQVTDDVCQLIF